MSKRIVTFGEIMLRLAPNGYYRFFQDDQLQATFGGGEANVAVSLANYGMDAAFVTKLPAHAIGQGAVNALRGLGRGHPLHRPGRRPHRLYYLEKGASQRGSVCIYDRRTPPFRRPSPPISIGMPSLTAPTGSTSLASLRRWVPIWWRSAREACVAAKKHGVKISCDLNYRGKLWTREQGPCRHDGAVPVRGRLHLQ